MTARWRWQVAWLLAWSRPFRGLLILVSAAAAMVVATTMCIGQLSLSPQQLAVSYLGSTQAKVVIIDGASNVPGDSLALPDWVAHVEAGVTVIPVWHGSVSLSVNEASFSEVFFQELALPSPSLEGNVKLTAGQWPTVPGECVSTMSATGQARPPVGEWTLTIVGQVMNVFQPTLDGFYCAPGTWETWNLTQLEQQTNRTAVAAEYFLLGAISAVSDEIIALVGAYRSGSIMVDTRWEILAPSMVAPHKFLGDRAPLLVIPFGLALVLAGRLARWSGSVSRVLIRAGVPALQMRRTMTGTMVGGTLAASLAGGLVGSFIAFVARPALTLSKGGAPLSTWHLPINDLLLVLTVCVIGVWLGARIGDAVLSARLGQQDRPARPLSTSAQIAWALGGVITGVVAVWLILAAHGRLWRMVGGALALVVAFASITPILVRKLGSVLSSRPVSASALAGRILVENSRRWSIITASLAAVLGLMCSLFVISATSIAGQVVLEASPIPAGSVRIEARNPGGDELPTTTLQQFEQDLGLTGSPVLLTETDVRLGGWGLIQTLATMQDVETLLGELPNAALEVLEQGGVAVIGKTMSSQDSMLAEPVYGQPSRTEAMVPVVSIRPDQAHRYTTGAGFALAHALADRLGQVDTIRVWFIYQGLTPAQDIEARNWRVNTGLDAFQTQAYRPSDGFDFPLWLAVSLIGFGLLLAPLLALVLRFDIRALVPLAATLKKIGLPKKWVRPVFTTLTGTVTSLAVLAAVVPALITGILFNALYPTTFDFGGAPWWMLAAFLGGILAATLISTQLSMRKLNKKEQVVTI